MTRTALAMTLVAALAAVTGCQTDQQTATTTPRPASLGSLGTADAPASSLLYPMGAGDALGQEIFARYMASREGQRQLAKLD